MLMDGYVVSQTSECGAIATLTFADPARSNQLCWAAIDQLADALEQSRREGVRVVVIASGLSGHWLEHAWLEDLCAGVEGRAQTGTGAGWFRALEALGHEDLISIAAINGNTSGGGAELGWACDFRIAERTACFAQPEINMSLTTGIGGCSRLMRLAGVTLATEMVMSGTAISAQRLFEQGALNQIVEHDQAIDVAMASARQLADKPPAALHALKRVLRRAEELPLAESLAFEQETFQQVVVSPEAISAMKLAQAGYDKSYQE